MSSNSERLVPAPRKTVALALAAACCLIVTVMTVFRLTQSSPRPPDHVLSTSSSATAPVSAQTCVECHEEQVERFQSAAHFNTLSPGDDPLAISRLNGRTFTDEVSGDTFCYLLENERLWLKSSRREKPLRVDWLFGSGHHACTPVTVIDTPEGHPAILQHVMSWYPDNTIGWTLGLDGEQRQLPGIHGVATPSIAQETHECFKCHTTWLPEEEGVLKLNRLIPNVTCTRCHSQAQLHVEDPELHPIESWSELTPLESVNRCGECHRRADHMTPDELVPENKLLVRFASASLVQSNCFLNQHQAQRMDCMTCHDPHEPASTEPIWYNGRCNSCHTDSSRCTSPSSTSDCIRCHMPKAKMQDGLFFTDHWIRAHEDSP